MGPTFGDPSLGTILDGVAKDLNGDGYSDVVLTGSSGKGRVLFSVAKYTLAPGQSSDFGAPSHNLALVDLNGDGLTDLLHTENTLHSMGLFYGAGPPGAPSFTFRNGNERILTGLNPWGVAVGDLNKDGKPDAVVANQDSRDVSIHLHLP